MASWSPLYVYFPTSYTYSQLNSLEISTPSFDPYPKYAQTPSSPYSRDLPFIGYGFTTSSPTSSTPLYAMFMTTSSISANSISNIWLTDTDFEPSASSPDDYIYVTEVWKPNSTNATTMYNPLIGSLALSAYPFSYDDHYGGNYNVWHHIVANSTTDIYAITVKSNGQWIGATYGYSGGYTYTILVGANSETNYDGIVVCTSSHSSGSGFSTMEGWSDCLLAVSGHDASNSITFNPSSSGTLYMYFRTDSGTLYPDDSGTYGNVEIRRTISQNKTVTLNANGGSGGTSSVSIATGTSASNYPSITLPTRSGFTFLGYWDAITGGNCYYSASGAGNRTFDKTEDCTLWAHWKPNITESYYQDAYVFCTDSAVVKSSTDGTRTVEIASSSPSAGAGTLTVSVYKVNGSTTTTGWSLTNSNKSLSIASGKASGTYTITIKISVAGSAPSYESNEITVDVDIDIVATSISSYGNVTLSKTTLTQYADFPASAFTVSTSTIGDYFQYTGTVSQTITYNNGATRDGTITESWSGTSKSFSTLGTTTTARGTVSFNTMSKVFTGEGNKTASATTNIGYREANTLGTQHYKNTSGTTGDNITYGTPTVSIGSGIVASGGSATVTCSVTNTITYYLKYTSGSYSSQQSGTSTGTAKWRITSNGNSAFTASGTSSTLSGVGTVYNSGGTISHSNMSNNARTDTVVVTAYNVDSTSKTATAQDVTQNSLGWAKPEITRTSTVSMPAAGGSKTGPEYATATQTQQYTSGYVVQTINVPNSAIAYTVATSKTGYSLESDGTVTVTNNTSTSTRNGFKVKIVATYNSRTSSSAYTTFNQPAGSQAYLNPVVTGFSYTSTAASGDTKTPTVTYYQDYAWNGVAGSGTRTENTGGTLAFTTTGTLPSGFSTGSNYATTGSVTWASRGATLGNALDAKNNLKVTVTMNSKTSDAYTCTSCVQSANYVTSITPKKSDGTDNAHFSYTNIGAGVTSASPTLSGGGLYTFSSGSTQLDTYASPTFGGTATYTRTYSWSGAQNGFTAINQSNGVLTATARGTTVGDARTSGTVTSVLTVTYTHPSGVSGGTITSSQKTSTATCTQNANAVTALALSVGSNTINYNGTTTATATATFSSGSTLNVSGDSGTTYTTNPTGIVTVTK